VRFLWPGDRTGSQPASTGDAGAAPETPPGAPDGFALFTLRRYDQGCGY